MNLNKKQKAIICCHVADGLRLEGELTRAVLAKVAETEPDNAKEYRKLTRMGLADLDPLFKKALAVMANIPEAEKKNHLGMNPAEMTEAKAKGKIVYKPEESKDGKQVRTTDGKVYDVTKHKDGGRTIKKAGPKKETKKEKRARRKAERTSAGYYS